MTLDAWLPCTGIKEGYWNSKNFLGWLRDTLLPTVNQRDLPVSVIILDDILSM